MEWITQEEFLHSRQTINWPSETLVDFVCSLFVFASTLHTISRSFIVPFVFARPLSSLTIYHKRFLSFAGSFEELCTGAPRACMCVCLRRGTWEMQTYAGSQWESFKLCFTLSLFMLIHTTTFLHCIIGITPQLHRSLLVFSLFFSSFRSRC